MPDQEETTSLVRAVANGAAPTAPAAAEALFAVVYRQLRQLAATYFRRETPGQTLQPTALVHEAFLRMVDQHGVDWKDRAHFFAVAAKAMRQILIDHARARGAQKRGGGQRRIALDCLTEDEPATIVPLDELPVDLLELHHAIERLSELDERQARVVELRFFAGLSVKEVGEVLDVSERTVTLDWSMARAWLSRTLTEGDSA